MADPISIIPLIVLAAQSVLTLTELINEYRGLDDTLQGLVDGLEALQEAIQTLKDSAALEEENYPKLRQLLSACTKRCDNFARLMRQCSAHPHKNRQSIRDWLTYRFNVNDISEFRDQIDDSKTTILIHMSTIAIKRNEANEEQARKYHKLIADTLPRLERRLNGVTDMLQNPARATGHRSGDEKDEWIRLAEERADTINCISICKTALQEITQRHPSGHQHREGSSTTDRGGPAIAEKGIENVITKLGDRLEVLEMRQKIREETREVLDAQVQVISAAQNRWDLRNISAGECASQSMISNPNVGFCAENIRAGNRAMQAFGNIVPTSLQQLSANHSANVRMLAVGENRTNYVPEECWDECSVNTAVDIHSQDEKFRDDTLKRGFRARGMSSRIRFWRAKTSS